MSEANLQFVIRHFMLYIILKAGKFHLTFGTFVCVLLLWLLFLGQNFNVHICHRSILCHLPSFCGGNKNYSTFKILNEFVFSAQFSEAIEIRQYNATYHPHSFNYTDGFFFCMNKELFFSTKLPNKVGNNQGHKEITIVSTFKAVSLGSDTQYSILKY